ncbi:MAG: hypothetical protein HMLKMBBP_00992 [Planctomycetes bacterium]|nr:hypothetical protein [Planctomycetota bacterium]
MLVHVALSLLAACGGDTPRAPDGPPVSVLLVTLDTTRPDHLSAYGYARPTSPALDALARRGVRFDDAWSHAPETGPSLATVLTSRLAPDTRVRGNAEKLAPSLPTMATVAKGAGRATAAFVSTTLLRRAACAFDRGFDVYDDEMTDPCFGHPAAQRIAVRTIDRAEAWVAEQRAAGRPYFAWVHLYDPHGPYDPPEPAPVLDATRHLVPERRVARNQIPPYQHLSPFREPFSDAADFADRYDREIAYADRHLGRLLAAIDPATTLVVVHADHGESLGEDEYWFRHGNLLHDAALRVPWILAGPGLPRGLAVSGDVRMVDLAPTALALAGLPPLPDAAGNDLSAAARGDAAPPRSELVAEARRREIVGDAYAIDVRWKIRVRSPGFDATVWPASGEHRGCDAGAARGLLERLAPWRVTPPGEAASDESGAALRSLGYR